VINQSAGRPIRSGIWAECEANFEENPCVEWCGNFPEIPCVYVLCSYGAVEYVGQTENLRKRITQHCHFRDGKIFDHVKVAYVEGSGRRLDLEQQLIARLNPRLNKTHKR
jgi:excinuclease UvrABC nuclease subunit